MNLRLLLLLCLPCGLLPAQVNPPEPATVSASAAAWYRQVREATERGQAGVLQELFKTPSPPPPPGVTAYAYATDLARGALELGWWPGLRRFVERAGSPPEGAADLRWLAGVAAAYQDDGAAVLAIQRHYRELDPQHPALLYLQALSNFLEWDQLGPAHPGARERLESARQTIDGATGDAARRSTTRGFDRRFLVLRAHILACDPNPDVYRVACADRVEVYPKNPDYLRDYLAVSELPLDLFADKAQTAGLTKKEIVIWDRFAEARFGPETAAATMQARLQQLPDTPDWARWRLGYLRSAWRSHKLLTQLEDWRGRHPEQADAERAAARLAALQALRDVFGAELPALLTTYTQLAVARRSALDAHLALQLGDALRPLPDFARGPWVDLEIELAALAGERPRTLARVKALAQEHRSDLPWLKRYADLIYRHADLREALAFHRHLARLEPENLEHPFNVASLAQRPTDFYQAVDDARLITELSNSLFELTAEEREAHRYAILCLSDTRVAAYAELFARVPQDYLPEPRHWLHYRDLLRDQETLLDRIEGRPGKPTDTTYRQLIERCAAAQPDNAWLQGQRRELAAARAKANS